MRTGQRSPAGRIHRHQQRAVMEKRPAREIPCIMCDKPILVASRNIVYCHACSDVRLNRLQQRQGQNNKICTDCGGKIKAKRADTLRCRECAKKYRSVTNAVRAWFARRDVTINNATRYCVDCGYPVDSGSTRCAKCSQKSRKKETSSFTWPRTYHNALRCLRDSWGQHDDEVLSELESHHAMISKEVATIAKGDHGWEKGMDIEPPEERIVTLSSLQQDIFDRIANIRKAVFD